MITIDLQNELNLVSLIPGQLATSTVTGTGVDISEYIGKLKVILDSAAGGSSDTLNVKLQESDALSSGYTDISGATFTEVTDAAAALEAIAQDTRNCKKYLRAVGTIAFTTTGFSFAVHFVGQKQTQ